jgi:hypothetical protein
MSDPIVIPGEPDTTIVEPDTTIVDASPTIIVTPPAEPEPEPVAEPVVQHQCLTLAEVEEMMRRVLDDMAMEEEIPEPEPEPPPASEPDTAPEPSHPFFRRRGKR